MKRVIYTVIVGGYDRLLEPPRFPGWDYVCFTDGKHGNTRARLGLSAWDIRTYDRDGLDDFRYSRLPKIVPHRFLNEYDYSVYIDGNAKLLQDPTQALETMGWPDFAVSKHPFRNFVLEEIEECIIQNKAPPSLLQAQRTAYQSDGIPDDLALMENNFLLRRHNKPNVTAVMDAWWEQMNIHSHRDQLSLPYVMWKQGFTPHVFDQDLKRTLFATKAHYRTPWSRWKRSFAKRMKK